MNAQQKLLVGIIQKINVFKSLDLQEVQSILKVCTMRNFQVEEVLYKAGDASDEMLILLKGQLIILSASGEPLGNVTAGHPIGEMGVFTGQPRSATVTAMAAGGGVAIRKMDVDILMARTPGIYIKVLKDMVDILSGRLSQSNEQNEQHMKTIARMRDQIERLVSKS